MSISDMDIPDVSPQLTQLDAEIDQLEKALEPILGGLGDVASKLPLLDQAKLNVLACYAIESLLFSSLRLNGVEAKNHSIFTELTRVKQYFDKIKKIETPPAVREAAVDTQAAIRFLRADLSDNKQTKEKLTEQLSREKEKAASKGSKGDKKRPAENSDPRGAGTDSGRQHLPKRPKGGSGKGKK